MEMCGPPSKLRATRETPMDMSAYWDIFKNVLWPTLLAYAAWLQTRLNQLTAKVDEQQVAISKFEVAVAKEYVTQSAMRDLESRMADMLNRIDDKVTRILERDRNA
jgi:hypothetical protein